MLWASPLSQGSQLLTRRSSGPSLFASRPFGQNMVLRHESSAEAVNALIRPSLPLRPRRSAFSSSNPLNSARKNAISESPTTQLASCRFAPACPSPSSSGPSRRPGRTRTCNGRFRETVGEVGISSSVFRDTDASHSDKQGPRGPIRSRRG